MTKNSQNTANSKNWGLLIVDVQGKLARLVQNSDAVIARIQTLVQCCQEFDFPIVVVEQNPSGLGSTVPEIEELLLNTEVMEKYFFNACSEISVIKTLESHGIDHWLVVGIEAHICVMQTALGLAEIGLNPMVVVDGISSRSKHSVDFAINNLQQNSIALTTVESFVYQYLETSQHPKFKNILRLIK